MYFQGEDWIYHDPNENIPGVERDFTQEGFGGDLRFDFRLNERSTLIVNGGAQRMASSIEMTGIGAAQAQDWTYTYAQGRFMSGNLFAQAYINMSDAGDTFTLRDGEKVSDNSLLYVGQIQHGVQLGERQRFTYGADLIRTIPRTDGVINGRNEDDDNISEVGAYLQSESQLSPMFDVVLAGRVDYHSVVDKLLFSPRAAVVFKPTGEHSLRATYNRAFSQPSSNNLFLDKLSSDNQLYPVLGRGAPSQGFGFERDCMGIEGPCIRSPFLPDRNTLLPYDATLLWDAAVGVLMQNPEVPDALKQLLPLIPAPNGTQVGTALLSLNPTTGRIEVPVGDVQDVPQTKSMITNTFEVGYKGLISDRLLLGVDVWYSEVENFIGPLLVETPNVFMSQADLVTYIGNLGLPIDETTVQQVAGALAAVPVGIVTPMPPGIDEELRTEEGGWDSNAIILAYRNHPTFDLWGADLGATFIATDWLSLTGSYSFVSENFFTAAELGAPTPLALNSPKNKGSLGARYRNERWGLMVEARGRYVEAFPVKTGVYVSNDAIGQPCTGRDCLENYALMDLNVSYALPISRATVISLTGTNILDNKHIQMIGAPELASMWLLRVQQGF
jgi:iron complex outermembrane receptor protein